MIKPRTDREKRLATESKRIERERIKRAIWSHLNSMRTSRADEYGAGWNGAIATLLSTTGVKS